MLRTLVLSLDNYLQVNHIEELLQELGPGGDDDEDCDPGVGADNEEEWVTDEEEEMDQNWLCVAGVCKIEKHLQSSCIFSYESVA